MTKGGMEVTKAYNICKDKVLSALRWLKKYNREYADITISEENLVWMGNENEKEIDDVHVIDHTKESSDFFCDDDDRGSAERQVFYPEERAESFMEASEAVNECDAPFITDKDTHLL